MNYSIYTKKISNEFNLSNAESERILKFFFEEISKDVAKGKRVYFRGFGSFKKILRRGRKYRNIATGKIEKSKEHKDVVFKPSKEILERT